MQKIFKICTQRNKVDHCTTEIELKIFNTEKNHSLFRQNVDENRYSLILSIMGNTVLVVLYRKRSEI